jgi:hypothetical protein
MRTADFVFGHEGNRIVGGGGGQIFGDRGTQLATRARQEREKFVISTSSFVAIDPHPSKEHSLVVVQRWHIH